jgi:hypothetical protein
MPDRGRSADKRLQLCRCQKGAAASREGSGINASGDAEGKEVGSMLLDGKETESSGLEGDAFDVFVEANLATQRRLRQIGI